jgi:hypothetical protein
LACSVGGDDTKPGLPKINSKKTPRGSGDWIFQGMAPVRIPRSSHGKIAKEYEDGGWRRDGFFPSSFCLLDALGDLGVLARFLPR